jgi:hypothetical protein
LNWNPGSEPIRAPNPESLAGKYTLVGPFEQAVKEGNQAELNPKDARAFVNPVAFMS